MKEQISEILKKVIKDKYDLDIVPLVETPRDPAHGDFSSNVYMKLEPIVGQSPRMIAQTTGSDVTTALKAIDPNAEDKFVEPGFINFTVSPNYYKNIISEILAEPESFGKNKNLQGKKILIEHTSPNPNKELHLGHVKNNVVGLAVSYILEANGAQVFRDCINNNRGIAIAKLMWAYLAFAKKEESLKTDLNVWFENKDKWFTPSEKNTKPGKFVDELYTKGSEAAKDPAVEEQVRQMVIDWEAEEPKNRALWQLTQDWVWEGYKQSLNRIDGWKFDQIWNESDLYKKGKEHVERGVKEGIFEKLEDGAILSHLKEFKLPDTILIKKDGTSLYITQDLELTKLKREKFNPDQMMWVIGPEQSLAMKQMFAVCSQLGFGKYEDYHHLPYGFVLIKGQSGGAEKMSSRKGTQIHSNDLIDLAKGKIKELINSELSTEEIEEISETLAIASIKYSLLKVGRTQDQVFDLDTSVSLEGDSAPYIIYTYARAKSILRESNKEDFIIKDYSEVLDSDEELELLKILGKFPEVVELAAKDYAPNTIANYVYDLAGTFNKFYNKHKVLKAESEQIKNARLALTAASAQIIKNGLNLLGIKTVEKM